MSRTLSQERNWSAAVSGFPCDTHSDRRSAELFLRTFIPVAHEYRFLSSSYPVSGLRRYWNHLAWLHTRPWKASPCSDVGWAMILKGWFGWPGWVTSLQVRFHGFRSMARHRTEHQSGFPAWIPLPCSIRAPAERWQRSRCTHCAVCLPASSHAGMWTCFHAGLLQHASGSSRASDSESGRNALGNAVGDRDDVTRSREQRAVQDFRNACSGS